MGSVIEVRPKEELFDYVVALARVTRGRPRKRNAHRQRQDEVFIALLLATRQIDDQTSSSICREKDITRASTDLLNDSIADP
jgi:hypothetical protein